MLAVHRRTEGTPGQSGGAGVRLLDGRIQGFTLSLPDRLRKRGLAQLPRRQRYGFGQQVRVGQRAQRKTHAVGTGTAAKRCTQISPGFTQCVFIQRGLGAGLTSQPTRQHTLACHAGGDARQPGFIRRVASAACVKIDLHIHHRDTGALHQIHLRTRGLRPLFNGDARE